ncbi:MAG: hypothetical protein Roseis3KO_01650 [Roseivirga sp.]
MEKENKQQGQSVEQRNKSIWSTPEIIDLDINVSTQHLVTKTASAPDSGPGFSDYNS